MAIPVRTDLQMRKRRTGRFNGRERLMEEVGKIASIQIVVVAPHTRAVTRAAKLSTAGQSAASRHAEKFDAALSAALFRKTAAELDLTTQVAPGPACRTRPRRLGEALCRATMA